MPRMVVILLWQHLGMGKPRIKGSKEIQQVSSLMSQHSATAEQIGKVDTRLFVITYSDKQEHSLNSLQYIKVMEMVSISGPSKASPNKKNSTLSQYTGALALSQYRLQKLSNNNLVGVGNLKDHYLHQ